MYIIVYIYIYIRFMADFPAYMLFFTRLSGDPLPRLISRGRYFWGSPLVGGEIWVESDTPWIFHLVMTNIAMERSTTFNR